MKEPVAMILELDDYEAINLLEALRYLKVVQGDTGDWHAQIHYKIFSQLKSALSPNKTWKQQLEDFKRFKEAIPPAPDPSLNSVKDGSSV